MTLLPLDLSSLKTAKSFAQQAVDKLGASDKLDYLLLNAGMMQDSTKKPGPNGSRWCEAYVVNHLCE